MLNVNAIKSTILVLKRYQSVNLVGEEVEVVDGFRYLRVKFSKDGNGNAKVESSLAREKNWRCTKRLGK